jgi:hypothetical protein
LKSVNQPKIDEPKDSFEFNENESHPKEEVVENTFDFSEPQQ